jgi:hypothetical protein
MVLGFKNIRFKSLEVSRNQGLEVTMSEGFRVQRV